VVETFASIRLAVISSGASRKKMDRVLQTKDVTCKICGYCWRYAAEGDAATDTDANLGFDVVPTKGRDGSSNFNGAATDGPASIPMMSNEKAILPHSDLREKQVSQVFVGTRVAIWWPEDKKVRGTLSESVDVSISLF